MKTSRVFVLYAIVLFALLLNGCRAINVGAEYVPDSLKGTGIMVISLTRSGTSGFNMFVDFRGVNNEYKNAVPVTDAFATSDWDCPFFGKIPEDQPCGRLAIVELPQGEYEFYSWHGGSGSSTVRARQEFSKRFKITAGKALYAGNIHFSINALLFNMKVVDMRQRDLPLLYRKNPKITPENILIDVLP